ncbi:MAG TPA: zinc-ribbon domain-containing protein [Syntrophobacteraceae bacterium]|nr:zinc-ribbon domain-containing protein [Syntrophobacteraceae bacterium]
MAMLVITCESCGAKFRLDADKLSRPSNKVRCSKCKNIFTVERPDENGLIHIEISDEESAFIPGAVPDDIGGTAPAPETREARLSSKKVLIAAAAGVLLLVALFLVFRLGGWVHRLTSKELPPVPATKPVVTIIDSVQAYYLENTYSGQVLVIEGEVLNESSKPVSFVMIEGKLYDSKDAISQIQRCYAGNSFTRKEIANLKLSEIEERMMNREGKNLKNVRIPPAGKAPFTLVFHNLPEISNLSNYSVNVISSKFD